MANWISKLQNTLKKYKNEPSDDSVKDAVYNNEIAHHFSELVSLVGQSKNINTSVATLYNEMLKIYNITTLSDGSIRNGYYSLYKKYSTIIYSAHSILNSNRITKPLYLALVEFSLELSKDIERLNKNLSIEEKSPLVSKNLDDEIKVLTDELNLVRLVNNQGNREDELRELFNNYQNEVTQANENLNGIRQKREKTFEIYTSSDEDEDEIMFERTEPFRVLPRIIKE